MDFSLVNYHEIAKALIPDWTRRSRSPLVLSMGSGCFIWDSRKDGITGSGMFYTRDMVAKYFGGEMAAELQQMIDDANHQLEVVVVLIFDEKMVGLRLAKSELSEATELVPPIIH